MNIVDILIIIFILFGGLLGFKRGFTNEVIRAIGFILIVIIAYFLKNPLSVLFYERLPFLKIGILKGAEVLNVLVYELLAFLIVLAVLSLALRVVIFATKVFEKILNATIILGLPSKILGFVVGLIHYYVITFIIVYALTLIFFDIKPLNESKFKNTIINDTPILSDLVDKTTDVVDEFRDLKDKYDDKTISESEFNKQAIELFLKYDVVEPSSIRKLINNGKITPFDYYEDLLKKYEGE